MEREQITIRLHSITKEERGQRSKYKEVKTMLKKSTKDLSVEELELKGLFDMQEEIKRQLKEIKTMVNDLYFKMQVSHSLLVVRKIGEENLEQLKQLLD